MAFFSLWRGLIEMDRPSIRDIKAEVAARYGVRVADLEGPSRARPLAHYRQEAMAQAYEHTGKSTTVIGREFGGRDHTTVLHAIRRHRERTVA